VAIAGLLVTLWCVPAVVRAQQPRAPTAAQEGYVPIDQLQAKEEIPAAPLVMTAFSVAWLVVFGYVWSIWRRLNKVEREIADIHRRVAGGAR
jgi:CcmD family protein